jgi:hypothetical protein
MNSILIIKTLNIPKDLMISLSKIFDRMMIELLSFEMTKPRFKTCIVIKVSLTTVRMLDVMTFKELVIFLDFLGQNVR